MVDDGFGPLPDGNDKYLEWVFVVVVTVSTAGFLVLTGLDAHLEYVLTDPVGYTGLSSVSSEGQGESGVVFSESDLDGIEFSTSNRVGLDAVGDEIGLCGGLRSDGSVYSLRVAEGFEETSRSSVTFSCGNPRNVILHSQPDYNGEQSAEDKSFDGEFRPEISCIVFSEPVLSPIANDVEGINCFEAGTEERVPVSVE